MFPAVLTASPITLRQWLLTSLGWTALYSACVGVAWYVCAPFSLAADQAGGGLRVFVAAAVQVWATIELGERAVGRFDQLYQKTRPANAWWLNAAARAWWLLLGVILALGLVLDAFLALLTVWAAAVDGSVYKLD